MFLVGLIFFIVGGLLVSPCVFDFGTGRSSCYIFGLIHVGSDISATHVLPLGFVGIGGFVLMIVIGLFAMYAAFEPVKLEYRHCPTCSKDTQQFEFGPKYKDGYNVFKSGMFSFKIVTKEELVANLVGYQYVCEECGEKNLTTNFCHRCGSKMDVGGSICNKCRTNWKAASLQV